VAYNTAMPGHPDDDEDNIKDCLKTTTDTFLCNMHQDWKYALIYGGDTSTSRRMVRLIEEELTCRELI
jgi:hypothetical protein